MLEVLRSVVSNDNFIIVLLGLPNKALLSFVIFVDYTLLHDQIIVYTRGYLTANVALGSVFF